MNDSALREVRVACYPRVGMNICRWEPQKMGTGLIRILEDFSRLAVESLADCFER